MGLGSSRGGTRAPPGGQLDRGRGVGRHGCGENGLGMGYRDGGVGFSLSIRKRQVPQAHGIPRDAL